MYVKYRIQNYIMNRKFNHFYETDTRRRLMKRCFLIFTNSIVSYTFNYLVRTIWFISVVYPNAEAVPKGRLQTSQCTNSHLNLSMSGFVQSTVATSPSPKALGYVVYISTLLTLKTLRATRTVLERRKKA